MHRIPALPRNRSAQLLTLLTWLLASLATAALAHVAIDLLGTLGAGGDAYDDHAHDSVAPIALGAVGLMTLLLLRTAALRFSRSSAVDPLLILATTFRAMSPRLPAVLVALGGFATLVLMEFTEQISAFGHIAGIADALGGNPGVGLATIMCIAALLTIGGLRSAKALLDVTIGTISALSCWILPDLRSPVDTRVQRRRDRYGSTIASPLLAESRGLRAPPTAR